MLQLPQIQLPLQPDRPPSGYSLDEHDISVTSMTTAFSSALDARDTFLGRRHCVICGNDNNNVLERCHIISKNEMSTWVDLKDRHWIPSKAKAHPEHEPRNGLTMCANHHSAFVKFDFFIRFFPETRKFVLINYTGQMSLWKHHGRAIALDIAHHYCPFPSLFIIHEMRARGFYPFQDPQPLVPDQILDQEWMHS